MVKKIILVADDEPSIRSLVSKMLSRDCTVFGAGDGKEAIDIARSQKPDLILMDIMMPKVDGYTACHLLKTHPSTKTIPVVMLTGIGYETNKKLGEEMGADGYVTKPFDQEQLREEINRTLTRGG